MKPLQPVTRTRTRASGGIAGGFPLKIDQVNRPCITLSCLSHMMRHCCIDGNALTNINGGHGYGGVSRGSARFLCISSVMFVPTDAIVSSVPDYFYHHRGSPREKASICAIIIAVAWKTLRPLQNNPTDSSSGQTVREVPGNIFVD